MLIDSARRLGLGAPESKTSTSPSSLRGNLVRFPLCFFIQDRKVLIRATPYIS
jgi:hypothetical protein